MRKPRLQRLWAEKMVPASLRVEQQLNSVMACIFLRPAESQRIWQQSQLPRRQLNTSLYGLRFEFEQPGGIDIFANSHGLESAHRTPVTLNVVALVHAEARLHDARYTAQKFCF